jgi:uncharacterized protein
VVWLPARGILDDVTFPPKLTYDSARAPKRGETRRHVHLSPLNVAALKERLTHVEAEAKANDPKSLRAEIASLKAELVKATKGIPQSVAIDPEAVEAAEIRGWNAGANAAHQSLIAKGRAVSDALAAMLATAVRFKGSGRAPALNAPPLRQKLSDKRTRHRLERTAGANPAEG